MNKDIFEGKWKQMRGQAKVWWGKLTDDDLDKVEGKYDKLATPTSKPKKNTKRGPNDKLSRSTNYRT
jgi:uncharacterized protein YjbJ (UPF0337 family)